MVGHSKWLKVKRIKAPLEVKRGAAFSKLGREIAVAARLGGDDLSGASRLRSVVGIARVANMPKDNVESIIKKGTGEHDLEVPKFAATAASSTYCSIEKGRPRFLVHSPMS